MFGLVFTLFNSESSFKTYSKDLTNSKRNETRLSRSIFLTSRDVAPLILTTLTIIIDRSIHERLLVVYILYVLRDSWSPPL